MAATRRKRRTSRRKVMKGGSTPFFSKAYVINMDSSKERLNTIMDAAKKAKIELVRFPAVIPDKTAIERDAGAELQKQGIPALIYMNRESKFQYPGTIGCFLSHRKLLEQIAGDSTNSSTATLILEDDAILQETLVQKVNEFVPDLPSDWDMCFIGKNHLDADKVKNSVHKLKNQFNPIKNTGTWAYFVKNASIKDKVLPSLKIMLNGMDAHYNFFQDKINTYAVHPNILEHATHNAESSDRMNLNAAINK